MWCMGMAGVAGSAGMAGVAGVAIGAIGAAGAVWANAAVVPIARPRASAICVIFILDSFVDESVQQAGIRPARGQSAPDKRTKAWVPNEISVMKHPPERAMSGQKQDYAVFGALAPLTAAFLAMRLA